MVSALTGGRSMITDTTLSAFSTMISLMGPSLSTPRIRQPFEWRLDPFRHRKLVRVQRHCHHGVVANQRRELDHATTPQSSSARR